MDYWLEGYNARSENQSSDSNPYVADLAKYGEWNKGWYKANSDINMFRRAKNKELEKKAFNDMHGKGFDSARQFSKLMQLYEESPGEYAWIWDVYEKHGLPWDWDKHTRDPRGRFKSFPPGIGPKESELKDLIVRFGKHLEKRGFVRESQLLNKILR